MDFTAFQADAFDADAFQIYSAPGGEEVTLNITATRQIADCKVVVTAVRFDVVTTCQDVLYVG